MKSVLAKKNYYSFTEDDNEDPLSNWLKKREKKLSDKICLFGTTFNYGTDDPFILFLLATLLRGTWLAYGAFLYTYYNVQPGCDTKQQSRALTAALVGLLLLYFLGLVTSLACAITSTLGTLIRPKPRRGVIVILHVLLFLFVAEFCWLIFTTYVAASHSVRPMSECRSYENVAVMFYVAVGSSWLIYFILIAGYFIDVDPCGCCSVISLMKNIHHLDSDSSLGSDEYSAQGLHNKDNNLIACCRCKGKMRRSTKTAMTDAVKSIGIIFGDFNATFTDLLAGFMLVKLYQKKLYLQGKSADAELCKATLNLLKHNETVPVDYETAPPTPLTKQEIKELSAKCSYYIKFAKAAYGGIDSLDSYESCKVLCKATRGCVCCPRRIAKYHREGESQFTNTAMISATVGLPQDCIIAFSLSNLVYQAPYFVTYNPSNCEIVISVQGSDSLQDVLTNVSITAINVPGLGGIDSAYVHRGFYKTAVNIYEEVIQNEQFMNILNHQMVDKFVFTGHSLGASVAIILSILFKDCHKDAPWVNKVESIGFCTPAATMNYILAEKVQDFVTSIVAPHDIVSRLTLRSLSYFKVMVETMLVTVDSNKQQALFCSDEEWYQCCQPAVPQDEDLVGISYLDYQKSSQLAQQEADSKVSYCALESHPKWKTHKGQRAVYKFLQNISYQRGLLWEDPEQPMLFVPGRILHIEVPGRYRTINTFGSLGREVVTGRWTARESFSAIVVHPDMLEDHRIDNLVKLLQRLEYQQITA